jgi:hypothetical protein
LRRPLGLLDALFQQLNACGIEQQTRVRGQSGLKGNIRQNAERRRDGVLELQAMILEQFTGDGSVAVVAFRAARQDLSPRTPLAAPSSRIAGGKGCYRQRSVNAGRPCGNTHGVLEDPIRLNWELTLTVE